MESHPVNNLSARQSRPTQLISMACLAILLCVACYLAIAVAASLVLTRAVPVSAEDLRNASTLGMRVGLGYHGVAIAAVFGVVGILQLLVGRLSGAILVLLGLCAYFATSEATALRQGVLDGDMRIGCFSYQSLECRRMLNLNEAGSVTMYKNPNELSLGGYADWYLPVLAHAQAKVQSNYPNAVPGVSFLRSPFVLLRIGEMNTQIRVQRDEVSLERARLGTQGPEASDRT